MSNKLKLYVRVAKRPTKGYAVAAGSKPNHQALTNSLGVALPTASFALLLDIPDSAFCRAEQVLAEIVLAEEDIGIAAEVSDQ